MTVQPATYRPGWRWRTKIGHLLLHIFLLVGGFLMTIPFLWMLSTSLTTPKDLFAYPPKWIPDPIAWDNYIKIMTIMPFGRFYLNSLWVATAVTALQLLTASLAAFAFARLQFRGRDLLFLLYLATIMIPFPVTMVPNFLVMRILGWIDSFKALIIPRSFSAFSTFLLRQYFLGIPTELDDAARIDGASSFTIWWRIIMPLSGPALATLGIFTFLGEWNSFLWPLIVTNSIEMRTLPVALAGLRGQFTTHWELIMAGSSISLLPILILYIVGQKWFVRGITLTGMGGH